MTEYLWELGIDWNAVQRQDRTYHLLDGFVPQSERFNLRLNDYIIFRAFEVTDGTPMVTSIGPLVITAEPDVLQDISREQFSSSSINPSVVFPAIVSNNNPPTPTSWSAAPVEVQLTAQNVPPVRFLLTFKLTVNGGTQNERIYRHDPEMVVGPGT